MRALCEFTAKAGDLDLRFTPSPTALEGIVGHRTVASRRSDDYQSEVAPRRCVSGPDGQGQGRTAMILAKLPRRGQDLPWRPEQATGQPSATALGTGQGLRLADAANLNLAQINLALVYFDIVSERKPVCSKRSAPPSSGSSSNTIAACSCTGPNRKRPIAKGVTLAARQLAFPHAEFRPGQRHLAESVFKAVSTALPDGPGTHGDRQAPSAPCSRCSRPWHPSNWTRCISSRRKPRDASWPWTPASDPRTAPMRRLCGCWR